MKASKLFSFYVMKDEKAVIHLWHLKGVLSPEFVSR